MNKANIMKIIRILYVLDNPVVGKANSTDSYAKFISGYELL